jgi:hypothetical protein
MIRAEKLTTIKPVPGADPIADTDIVHSEHLIICVTQGDEHYHLFESLLKSLNIKIEEKIKSE